MTTLRPYRPTDRADVYDVCVRTADGGDDATGLYSSGGAPAVHVTMLAANTPARAFYDRLGFRELPLRLPDLTVLGAPTDQQV